MRSRKRIAPLALLVLAAWGNAQAMSCCWLPDLAAVVRAWDSTADAAEAPETAQAPMAADHSCCAGASAATAERASGDDAASPSGCGFGDSGTLAECCERADAAAASAALAAADLLPAPVPAPAPAWFALLADLALDESPSGFVAPDVTVRTGPPVWLSVGHLLI